MEAKGVPFYPPFVIAMFYGDLNHNYLGQRKVKQTLQPLSLTVRTSPSDDCALTN